MKLTKLRPLIALLLAAVLLCCSGCALLTGPVTDVDATTTSTNTTTTARQVQYKDLLLSLGTATGAEGETVELALTVSAEAYLVNADLLLRYDPTLLKPIVDEDGACAVAADWTGGLWSAETEAGCIKLMLATAEDGAATRMTLCTVRFRVLSEQTATVVLDATAVGCCQPGDAGADVWASGLVQLADGTVN